MSFTYMLVRGLLKLITKTFFREIQVLGTENVPKKKGTIIVSIHRNQFVDGIMIVAAVDHRDVRFVVAAKTHRKPIIGHLTRGTGCIPVERPQDLAKTGVGKIISNTNGRLKGKKTFFSKELKVGDMILIQRFEDEVAVKEILSDEEIVVSGLPSDGKIDSPAGFKIVPKIDQTKVFAKVWEALRDGECIGIFPEGGSHDRANFLPLKAGVAIMSLGCMATYDCEVDIVPCGLSYYKGHQFRSKAVLEFGHPILIPKDLVELYKVNKREAIAKLLYDIQTRLQDITMTAPSYSLMMTMLLLKNVYKPDHAEITQEQEIELNKRFLKGYEKTKEEPIMKELIDSIKTYRGRLKYIGIEDYQVKEFSPNFFRSVKSIIYSFLLCIMSFAFAIPGALISAPFAFLISYLGERERRKALAASKVKVLGKDVVASHKIVCAIGLFPFYAIFFTFCHYLLIKTYFTQNVFYQFFLTFSFFLLWPIYAYIMVKSSDGFVRYFKTFKAKLLFLFDESKYSQLRFFRKTIQVKIRDFVTTEGNRIFGPDFQETRIFKKTDLSRERRNSAQLRSVFQSLEEMGI